MLNLSEKKFPILKRFSSISSSILITTVTGMININCWTTLIVMAIMLLLMINHHHHHLPKGGYLSLSLSSSLSCSSSSFPQKCNFIFIFSFIIVFISIFILLIAIITTRVDNCWRVGSRSKLSSCSTLLAHLSFTLLLTFLKYNPIQ